MYGTLSCLLVNVTSISEMVMKPPSGDDSVRERTFALEPFGIQDMTAAGLLLVVVQVKVKVSPALASSVPEIVADFGATERYYNNNKSLLSILLCSCTNCENCKHDFFLQIKGHYS